MTIKSTNVDPAGTAVFLPTDTVFELLLDDRRRYAMYSLSQRRRGISLDELVDQLVAREGPLTDGQRDEIELSFRHNHLRKLVDAGVVSYDSETDTIDRRRAARALDPYLELAVRDSIGV